MRMNIKWQLLMNCAVELGKEMIDDFDKSIDEIMYDDMIKAAADVLWDAIMTFSIAHFTNLSQKNMDTTHQVRFPKKLIYDEDVS